jgi:sRNA-binding carbon storage regulator CsrA
MNEIRRHTTRGGDKARLGFTADESVKIYRREVYEAIQRSLSPPEPPCQTKMP